MSPITVETYSDNKYQYSVDLMHAYINLQQPEKQK